MTTDETDINEWFDDLTWNGDYPHRERVAEPMYRHCDKCGEAMNSDWTLAMKLRHYKGECVEPQGSKRMTTDDTARAILDYEDRVFGMTRLSVAVWNGCEDDGNYGNLLTDNFIDVRAMAKLWLMRDEILAVMSDAGSSMHGCSQQFFDVEKRLQALEGE